MPMHLYCVHSKRSSGVVGGGGGGGGGGGRGGGGDDKAKVKRCVNHNKE